MTNKIYMHRVHKFEPLPGSTAMRQKLTSIFYCSPDNYCLRSKENIVDFIMLLFGWQILVTTMNIFALHFFTNASSLICSCMFWVFVYLFISEDHFSHFIDVSFGQETLDELTNVSGTEFEIPANFDEQVCASWNSTFRGLYHFLYLFCRFLNSHHIQGAVDSHIGAEWPGSSTVMSIWQITRCLTLSVQNYCWL